MSELTQKTLETIKDNLQKQQKQVAKNLESVSKEDPVTGNDLAESTEPGTDAWLAEEHTSFVAIGTSLKTTASGVAKALNKIAHGTYGKCEECNKYIEVSRLLAMPTATFCLSCSKKSAK